MTKKPNHLISENSPYLLQHAYNPVDWFPWGSVSLEKASRENKLLVVSIGYAACHWCHVMEHESFEDDEVASAMNERFVSVKVDREERPDIDQVYMTAAYATTGRGGWPLNVIALPDQRPVFAGTYFRKSDWLYILKYYADLYAEQPGELHYQAQQIATGMKKQFQFPVPFDSAGISSAKMDQIFETMQRDFDPEQGGSIGAPKFPMPVNLDFLMTYGQLNADNRALEHVELTLTKMRTGGIYDQLGGGFCRYSVDDEWHVPHFEKMLYDNAQLISLYAKGYRHWKKFNWKEVVEETIAFTASELTSPEGLFYASIDADSEGHEGAFYVWKEEEIRKYLDLNPDVFLSYFNCTPGGNWEAGNNVLKRSGAEIVDDDLFAYLQVCRQQLKIVRDNRPRPATDDKILTCWNALMISALVEASLTFEKEEWMDSAIRVAGFYKSHLETRNGKLWRNAKGGNLTIPGFLDDYSLLIKAFLDLYQATFDDVWLKTAHQLTNRVLSEFSASGNIFFNLSPSDEPVVVMKSAELSDNVIPASNSVMAHNLFVLGHLLGKTSLIGRAEQMANAMLHDVRKNPSFHANWATLLTYLTCGVAEVQIVGEQATELRKSFGKLFLPGVIWSGGTAGLATGLSERLVEGKTWIYVCRDRSCFPPVESVNEALLNIQMTNGKKS